MSKIAEQLAPDLFSAPYPTTPGFKEHDTSKEAAKAISGRAEILRDRALTRIANRPSTADEVAEALGESVLAIRPRITELKQLGKIERSGERRANASGQKAHVWRVA